MATVPPGFSYRVINSVRTLPYSPNVNLPPANGEYEPPNPVRTSGKQLDLIIPEVPERHALLGEFLDSWSLLENMLHFCAQKLIETDLRTTKVIMGSLGTRQIMDLISALAVLKFSEANAQLFVTLMERVGKLNSKRNILVHGQWVVEAVVYSAKNEAHIKSQYVRVVLPSDPKISALTANLKNQKERVKYIFTLKRIAGVTKDVQRLSADIAVALREVKLSDAWIACRPKAS